MAHSAHQLVQFTCQTFFLTQSGEVARVVDQHPAVDGHGASNGRLFCQGSDHARKVPRKEALNSVGARFQALTVRLVNERFRDHFSQAAQTADGVR